MKTRTKLILSILLVMLIVPLSFMVTITAVSLDSLPAEDNLKVNMLSGGDVVEFGSYPQTKVTDSELIDELNSLPLNWVSYRYFSGSGEACSMAEGDYMQYADVTYHDNRYRAVLFTSYRPKATCFSNEDNDAVYSQKISQYYIDTIYWFKFEPLEWRVIDPDRGLMICDKLIDGQPFNNVMYDQMTGPSYQRRRHWYIDQDHTMLASVWETSTIREWMNNSFYDTAFNSDEKNHILNARITTDDLNTYDNVFLASADEILQAQGFFTLEALCTDYSFCQGVIRENKNYTTAVYFLRNKPSGYYLDGGETRGHDSFVYDVDRGGDYQGGNFLATVGRSDFVYGIRPVICYSDLFYDEYGQLHKDSDVRIELRDEETQDLLNSDENVITVTYNDSLGEENETPGSNGIIYINENKFPINYFTAIVKRSLHRVVGLSMNYSHWNYYIHIDESIMPNEELTSVFLPNLELISGSVIANDEDVVKPSCVKNGLVHFVCPMCETVLTEVLDSKGHTPANPVIENEKVATCSEFGRYDSVVYCSTCNEELDRETVTIDSIDHTTVLMNAKVATTTECGYTGDEVCTVCGQTIKVGEIIPSLVDSNTPGQSDEPTSRRCPFCGKDHSGNFIQKIIAFFHRIFALLFGARY